MALTAKLSWRHELNYDSVALGRMPYKVTNDPMVKPLRELVYLPKGIIDPHDLPSNTRRPGLFPQEILEQQEVKSSGPHLQ